MLIFVNIRNNMRTLRDGIAQSNSYKEVEVNFISGRKAVLTIFKDGKEQEKITLSDYNDKDKLHALFVEKGFTKYSDIELTERRKMIEQKRRKAVILSPKLRKKDTKEKLRKLRQARENFGFTPPVDKKVDQKR